MANTGRKVYQFLKQVDANTGVPTGLVKANVPGDPDYQVPVVDYADCPVVGWVATGAACEVNEFGNTGNKIFATRDRLTNGALDGYSETNTPTGGLGPYFPPVLDTINCPPAVPPPPPPPPVGSIRLVNSFNTATVNNLIGVSGLSPAFSPVIGSASYLGTHGTFTGPITFTRTGPVPAGSTFHARLLVNGIEVTGSPIQADSTTSYTFPSRSYLSTDDIELELST